MCEKRVQPLGRKRDLQLLHTEDQDVCVLRTRHSNEKFNHTQYGLEGPTFVLKSIECPAFLGHFGTGREGKFCSLQPLCDAALAPPARYAQNTRQGFIMQEAHGQKR